MKKIVLSLFALLLFAGSMTSCTKKCKGGGWYGNRNLGYMPVEKKDKLETEAVATVTELIKEEDCEEIAD